MIVKATDEEAGLLDRCLKYSAEYFDEVVITITGENAECERVANKYDAKISHFEWVNDFAKARNYNFSHASGDYIMWLDADDVVKGGENIRSAIEEMDKNGVDVGIMEYLYDFNENGECTVKHKKARILKNGSVSWVGALHEDFNDLKENRKYFIENIEVLHLSSENRANVSARRNLEIALKQKSLSDDPRNLWLTATSYVGVGDKKNAITEFCEFVKYSNSKDEKYVAYLYLADLTGDSSYAHKAMDLRPNYPNAYFKIAEFTDDDESVRDYIEVGLQLPKPEGLIFHNPRDYDYNPLMLLMRANFNMGHYKKSIDILDKMLEWYPKDESLLSLRRQVDSKLGENVNVEKYSERLIAENDDDSFMKIVDELPSDIRINPEICRIINERIIKDETSGKDLVYYCGYTSKEWSPKSIVEGGIGGSEENVIYTAKGLSSHGWNVTVYNNCGKMAGEYDGVSYRPFWEYNIRDRQDVTILWRHPRFAEHVTERAGKVFVDMHDVIADAEFTPKRLKNIDKVFVKTEFHKSLFPSVPDDKVSVIPNGFDSSMFEGKIEKDPYLIINTSSPDRHLESTLDIFEKLIEKSDKPWKLTWYYGWDVFDVVHEKGTEQSDWKEAQMKRFNRLVENGRAEGGFMIGQDEIAKKMKHASVFLYPTRFPEIFCISAVKAQSAGAVPVVSDYGALNETVQYGTKVHEDTDVLSSTISENQGRSIDDYVNAILSIKSQEGMEAWANSEYNWEKVIKMTNYEISNS